jgi:hypothetical protein
MFDPADMELDMVDEVHGSLFSTVSFPVLIFYFCFPPCRIELTNNTTKQSNPLSRSNQL